MLNREDFTLLLEKYASGNISPEERSELFYCISSGIYDDFLLRHIEHNLQTPGMDGANLPLHRSADILHKILSSEKQNAVLLPGRSVRIKVMRWALAAAILIAVAAVYFMSNNDIIKPVSTIAFTKDMEEKVNTSGKPLKVVMEDGSIVTLQPGSSIHYLHHFLPEKREVFLEGEAFFEVSKNAVRPFFVFNKDIITRVLGTSFTVSLNKETRQVEVSVRSGRVEVYENKYRLRNSPEKNNNGVILLPNQKVVYEQDTRQFVPSLVDAPLPVIDESNDKKIPVESFVFEGTPLKKVLTSLEKTYEIEIVVEKENIYKCLFTGDVSRQELYTRLDVICQSIQATYEIKGTKILIKGSGCN